MRAFFDFRVMGRSENSSNHFIYRMELLMRVDFKKIESQLQTIAAWIDKGAFDSIDDLRKFIDGQKGCKLPFNPNMFLENTKNLWQGADIAVVPELPPGAYQGGMENFAEPEYLVTEFAVQISILFYAMRDLFSPDLVDWENKEVFYARLAAAVESCKKRHGGKAGVRHLLHAMVRKGLVMLDEFKRRKFKALPVGPVQLSFGEDE